MKVTKAILFDLEGTVIDTEPIWDEADTAFLAGHGVDYPRERIIHLMLGSDIRTGVEIFKKELGLKGDTDELTAERRANMSRHLEREITFIPGFQEFFAHVRHHYPVAIATSMERGYLKSVDSALLLSELFDNHVYSIEDIGHIAKPNPDIFLYAAKKLGVAPKHCLVIEDAPHGVEAAHRAGMRCAALTTTTTRQNLAAADQIVDRYSEIVIS